MSSGRTRRLLRSTAFRLTAWYVVVFGVSLLVVAAVEQTFVAGAFDSRERAVVTARLQEYRTEFETHGIAGLSQRVSTRVEIRQGESVVLSDGVRTLYEHEPQPQPDTTRFSGLKAGAPSIEVHRGTDGLTWHVGVAMLSGNLRLQVGHSNAEELELLKRVRDASLSALGIALLLGLVGGAVFTRRALRPVRALSAITSGIVRSGKLDERVPTRGGGDDLDELAELFNRMLDRNQRLVEGMREALDNVGHDLRTPLTRLRASAELALRTHDDTAALREALADSMEESDRVLTMLRTLMDISATETGVMRLERQPVELGTLAREVLETYGMVAEERGVKVVSNLLPARVLGDATRLRQLIANLIDNAVKYTPAGGVVEVGTRSVGGFGEIQVCDTGAGIAEHDKERIFERLYRGDRSRSEPGLGLGLSFVKAISDAHGGTIQVVSAIGKGTDVTVRFPGAGDE